MEEALNSSPIKEVCIKPLKAKKGNKKALRDIELMVAGLKIAYK
jgi:hypothetical protein